MSTAALLAIVVGPFAPAVVWLPLAAGWLGRVPGLAFGLPLLVVAGAVFAATHHEDPGAILRATLHWVGWLGGILGAVLAAVIAIGWLV